MSEAWRWTFFGFQSAQEGRPIQAWYDGLPEAHKSEVVDLLLYLQNVIDRLWTRPFFDPLEGEGGISEIIVPDIRDAQGVAYYRIYGCPGPEKRDYTFLHATNKKVRNDRDGKNTARDRLARLRNQDATVHKFNFEKSSVGEISKGTERKN
jgi:hypothetical protein